MSFIAREIMPNEAQDFENLAFKTGSVFCSNWFIQILEKDLSSVKKIGVFSGSNLIGGFCISEKKKLFFSLIKDPRFAPNCGAFCINESKSQFKRLSFQKAFVSAIGDYLVNCKALVAHISLPSNFIDAQPLIWKKLDVRPAFTYRLFLEKIVKKDLVEITYTSPDIRRKAFKDPSILIEKGNEKGIEEFLTPIMYSLKKAKIKIEPRELRVIAELSINSPEFSEMYVARSEGLVVASALTIIGNDVCYLILGGQLEGHSNAYARLLTSLIENSKERGVKIFDFEGSMNISVENYFRQFGGEIIPYWSVIKSPNLLLRYIRRRQVRSYWG
jgi:hypothetical protein